MVHHFPDQPLSLHCVKCGLTDPEIELNRQYPTLPKRYDIHPVTETSC